MLLPSENFIGDQLATVDPDAIHAAREELRTQLGQALLPTWRRLYAELAQGSYVYSPEAKGRRRLRNVALGYIAASGAEDAAALAFAQFRGGGQHDRPAGGADHAGPFRRPRTGRGAGAFPCALCG